jgi:hypothetical protein
MKHIIPLLLLSLLISCEKYNTYIGTIMLTSDTDCIVRVFDTDGSQIFYSDYESGKPPLIVSVRSVGVYIIHAESIRKTVKKPLPYLGGNIEYFIEF